MAVWPAKLYSKFPVILERQLSDLNRTPYDRANSGFMIPAQDYL